MHPDIAWAVERNRQTAARRGEAPPVAAPRNAFAQLAALGQNHGRPLLAAPLTPGMRAVLVLAHRGAGYVSRVAAQDATHVAGGTLLRGLHRRHLGELVISGGVIIGFRLNNSGRHEAARLAEG